MTGAGKTYVKNIFEAWEKNHVKESVAIFESGGWSGEPEKNSDPIDPDQKAEDYSNWFAVQVQILFNRGMPVVQLKLIENIKEGVIAQALWMNFRKGEIPFLIVPLSVVVSVPMFMRMATCKDQIGFTSLDPRKIVDFVGIPNKLWYAIFGVKTKKLASFETSSDRRSIIEAQSRFWLTVQETIAVCVYTDALFNNPLIADGSRYGKSKTAIPYIKLDVTGPELTTGRGEDIINKPGWLSCQGRA